MACAGDRERSFERVVLIVADTLRRDHVQPYANLAETPHLAALAARGQAFENVSASFHQTTASMAALFTGHTPSLELGDGRLALAWTGRHWCGMRRFSTSDDEACVPSAVSTLAEDMRERGYETLAVVSNELLFRPAGYDQGFDTWVEVGLPLTRPKKAPRLRLPPRQGDEVARAARAVLDGRRSDRFFLYAHFMDAHDWGGMKLPSYAHGAEKADRWIGDLLDALEERGLVEGTLIVFTSDHGEMLARDGHLLRRGHAGNPSLEPMLRIPLIVAPATKLDASTPLRSQDLRALITSLVGAQAQVESALEPDEFFTSELGWQTYRRGRWKSTWQRSGEAGQLFDLETDPQELNDVAAAHPERLREHRARVDALARQLASERAAAGGLTDDDRERLEALGYLEPEPAR